jgi:hypothetical protein
MLSYKSDFNEKLFLHNITMYNIYTTHAHRFTCIGPPMVWTNHSSISIGLDTTLIQTKIPDPTQIKQLKKSDLYEGENIRRKIETKQRRPYGGWVVGVVCGGGGSAEYGKTLLNFYIFPASQNATSHTLSPAPNLQNHQLYN